MSCHDPILPLRLLIASAMECRQPSRHKSRYGVQHLICATMAKARHSLGGVNPEYAKSEAAR